MALKLFVHDTTSGTCELAGLVPYPKVTTSDPTVTITPTVDATTGQTSYDLAVEHTVDINVDNFSYDPATQDITLTETDGTVHVIDLTDLLDNVTSTVTPVVTAGNVVATHDDGEGTVVDIFETVTAVVVDGPGFVYVDEAGDKTLITLCEMASNLPDNGTVVGG